MSFASFGLHPKLLKNLAELGFEHPTPIQAMAIPPLMEGKDVMASAVTGSGKTAAFLLPLLHRIMDKPRGTTRALVLAPTRELAAQIAEHLRDLAAHTSIRGMAVYGGVSMGPQEDAFKKGADVIIATPGRLLDHFQYPYAKLSGLEYLVLDEGDRMLDMGFLPDIRRVLKHIPPKRQNLLFSATLPLPIVELAQEFLKSPVALNVHRKSAPAAGITHVAYPVPHELKSNLLLELLKKPGARSVLAFTRTRHRAKRLAAFLEKRGISCTQIHGSRSQAQRTEALAGFKRGRFRVLVATDIAARGIDVDALGLVVNFDVPNLPEDYIHRVGRTARLHAKGDAFTLVSPDEEGDLRTIERHLGKPLPREKVEGFDYAKKPEEKFEIPLAERIAAIRARKAEERARAKAKAERREASQNSPRREARGNNERREASQNSPRREARGNNERREASQNSPRCEARGNTERRVASQNSPRREARGNNERREASQNSPRREARGNNERRQANQTAPRHEARGNSERSQANQTTPRHKADGHTERRAAIPIALRRSADEEMERRLAWGSTKNREVNGNVAPRQEQPRHAEDSDDNRGNLQQATPREAEKHPPEHSMKRQHGKGRGQHRESQPPSQNAGGQAAPRSHRDEQGGRSHWAREWRRRNQPEDRQPETQS